MYIVKISRIHTNSSRGASLAMLKIMVARQGNERTTQNGYFTINISSSIVMVGMT
jgi:hypothetical protein